MDEKIVTWIMRNMRYVFACCLITITVLAIIPSTTLPNGLNFWDKAQHTLAFAALAFTGCLAFAAKTRSVCIGLILYGAIIEVIQRYFTTTHVGDIQDLLADSIGVMIGFLICRLFHAMLTRLTPK